MEILIAGFIVFFGTHLSPGVFGLRHALVERLGEGRFRGLYIAASVTGMTGIIVGKSVADYVSIYIPPLWAKPIVPVLLTIAFILLAALLLPTNIKRLSRHPMLWGVSLWSVGHLLANGDLASIIMFGGFGAYALISIWSLNRRGTPVSTQRYPLVNDVLTVAAGLAAFFAIVWLHPWLFGVPAIL